MEKVYMLRVETYSKYNFLLETVTHGAFKTFRGASKFAFEEGFEASYDDVLSELNDEETISFLLMDNKTENLKKAFVDSYLIHD